MTPANDNFHPDYTAVYLMLVPLVSFGGFIAGALAAFAGGM